MSTTSQPLVLLTGPSGFVGAHVLAQLLSSGYRVRGTIRSDSRATHLKARYPSQSESGALSFAIVPDLQEPHALDDAIADVDYVCHVASPYFTTSDDPVKELINPAVDGTRAVVASALRSKTLKRLTIMSSTAAVIDFDQNPRAGFVYTAEHWNPVTLEQGKANGRKGYQASKTFAERAAWDMWREARPAWDLVTFCPPMVYGPPIHDVNRDKGVAGLNTSVKVLVTNITGEEPSFKPKVGIPGLPAWVDVRNVAQAHVRSLGLPKGTSERFLLCGGMAYYEDGLRGLRANGTKGLGEVGEKIDKNKHFSIDARKAGEVLGLEWIAFEKTVEDVWEVMNGLGFVETSS